MEVLCGDDGDDNGGGDGLVEERGSSKAFAEDDCCTWMGRV